jgi:hypothetical protein
VTVLPFVSHKWKFSYLEFFHPGTFFLKQF